MVQNTKIDNLLALEERASEAVRMVRADILNSPLSEEEHYAVKKIIGIGAHSQDFGGALERFTSYLKAFKPDYASRAHADVTKEGMPKISVMAYRHNADHFQD